MMKGILRKDLLFLSQQGKLIAFLILFFSVMGLIQNLKSQSYGFMPLLFLYGSMLPHMVLSNDKQTRFFFTFGTLPVTRQQYLNEKYLLALAGEGIMAVFTLLLLLLCCLVSGRAFGTEEISMILGGAGIGLLFPSASILIWTIFCNKDKTAYTIASILMGGLLGGLISIVLTVTESDILELRGAAVLFGSAAAALAVSFCIASAVFRRKDLC
ncbi:MAG: ABC-2 transporter permease [Oscillospiraceae bacterium]|nr:ABC-2 transporter permease [Oscillospiraceae bacterium]